MELHIHLRYANNRFIATANGIPGCQGIGDSADEAVHRLQRTIDSVVDRVPPSPFAAVRKRLAEPGRGRQGFE